MTMNDPYNSYSLSISHYQGPVDDDGWFAGRHLFPMGDLLVKPDCYRSLGQTPGP